MDQIDHFIAEHNISRFFTKLAHEPEIAQRVTLSRMLVAEEDKFGEQAAKLDGLDSLIARCDAQIARHQALLDTGVFSNQDLVQNFLKNMTALRTTLQLARRGASRDLESLKGP